MFFNLFSEPANMDGQRIVIYKASAAVPQFVQNHFSCQNAPLIPKEQAEQTILHGSQKEQLLFQPYTVFRQMNPKVSGT